MLPTVNLDDERFEDIMEKARKTIPNLCPFWTDYNYHDPGITILELLAWLKETQQFHMDQIGSDHIRKYMMLLGGKQRHIIPASALITISQLKKQEFIPKGSRFWASDIPFETTDFRYLAKSRIERIRTVDADYTVSGNRLQIPMFGNDPVPEVSFYVGLSAPLERDKEHRLYFMLYHGYSVKRPLVGKSKSFVPLASLTVEYYYDGAYHPVEWWEDRTHQFLEDGFFLLHFKKNMDPDDQGRYWIRFTLKEAEYDVPPILERISLHELEARQMYTLCEYHRFWWKPGETPLIETDTFLGKFGSYEIYLETPDGLQRYEGDIERGESQGQVRFTLTGDLAEEAGAGMLLCYDEALGDKRLLGYGDGFPDQEIEVDISQLCAEGLELLVETKEGSGVFELWNRVEDFSGSGVLDACYTYDEENGILSFGNCIRGRVPRGQILMASGHTSLGAGGNVKAGTIQIYETDASRISIVNMEDAKGGKDRETLTECQDRVNRELGQIERAITYEDYETLVRRTPGLMIEKVRAIPANQKVKQDGSFDENQITLVVKPFSEKSRPIPGKAYLKNIINMLEPRRLIGTRLNILPPEYIGIRLFAEIETDANYRQVKQNMGEALNRYFERQENNFGQMVSYGAIYGIVDGVENVTTVRSLSLDAQGNMIRRSLNGDILLPVNGLAYLEEWDCMISSVG